MHSYFHRTDMARRYAQVALNDRVGTTGGLFLAAPRRTGKSTFVRQDLVPALEAAGAEVIYVDLWADRGKDPAVLMSDEVRKALAGHAGIVSRLASKAGIAKLSIGAMGSGLNFDLTSLGLGATATLTDALQMLAEADRKKIVFVIDEAQHALTTTTGDDALFALKAARDALNLTGLGLQVIGTGSNRDKLAVLVKSRDQAFFGATMIDFPKLDRTYIAWLQAGSGLPLDVDKTFDVFKKAGSRPEIILGAINELSLAVELPADLDSRFAALVEASIQGYRDSFFRTLSDLPPIQAALVREMALDAVPRNSNRPTGLFSGEMVRRLAKRLAESGSTDVKVDTSAIQAAVESLRQQNFVWKSERGAYWLEDDQVVSWLTTDASRLAGDEPEHMGDSSVDERIG